MADLTLINNRKELAQALAHVSQELNEDPEDIMLRLFRMQAPKAMLVLTELMTDESTPASVRLKAAEHILGRAIGPIKGKLTIKTASDTLYDEIIEIKVDTTMEVDNAA